jgi:hypothetical protein
MSTHFVSDEKYLGKDAVINRLKVTLVVSFLNLHCILYLVLWVLMKIPGTQTHRAAQYCPRYRMVVFIL